MQKLNCILLTFTIQVGSKTNLINIQVSTFYVPTTQIDNLHASLYLCHERDNPKNKSTNAFKVFASITKQNKNKNKKH